ncbi:hypothetical protein [Streptomyces longhuiensis]|uniref:hypothetical protein n=1 Tax=Streptomyces longhuiensis TaxID=2880933 RepID=UPI001D0A59C5|nr:hypothetical protein [Streptomyces longhuiensis]UDL97803.1 hypothetical protein LGI35_05790 [Streptomyces longhuiensis]
MTIVGVSAVGLVRESVCGEPRIEFRRAEIVIEVAGARVRYRIVSQVDPLPAGVHLFMRPKPGSVPDRNLAFSKLNLTPMITGPWKVPPLASLLV